ncbi:MAG: gamma-glutamylcyclotransferase [Deferribacterales bacterium]
MEVLVTVESKIINYLFVYGTLKKSKPYNYLLKKAKFISEATTLEKYALYFDNIPYLYKKDSISQIHGEVYQVDEDLLKEIDTFEDHPEYYKRELTEIKLPTGEIIKAWVYFFPEKKGTLISSGRY